MRAAVGVVAVVMVVWLRSGGAKVLTERESCGEEEQQANGVEEIAQDGGGTGVHGCRWWWCWLRKGTMWLA